jgi:Ni/Fe-hydrogenase 1 B-type cytochrome subunit
MKKPPTHEPSDAEWKRPSHGQVRIYVWQWPVRVVHWIIFATIVSLSITGYYMHSPFVIPHGKTAYVMGTMRFVHVLSGFVFLAAVLVRIVWMFIGNRWSRWDQFIPTTKKRFKDFLETGRYYGYMSWAPPRHIGHNAIAGFSYAAVYGMAFVEIFTGLALFSGVLGSRMLSFFFGWIPRLIDIQWLREIHFLVMFGFWMFFIYHVYMAMLVSIEEKNGVMESIFTGYKFLSEGELREAVADDAGKDNEQRVEAIRPSQVGARSSQSGA